MGSDAPRTYTGPADPEIKWLTAEIYDELNDITLNVLYVCGCQERVVDLGEQSFECLHCDRFCDIKDCEHCEALEQSDVESYLAALEDEEDGDADL